MGFSILIIKNTTQKQHVSFGATLLSYKSGKYIYIYIFSLAKPIATYCKYEWNGEYVHCDIFTDIKSSNKSILWTFQLLKFVSIINFDYFSNEINIFFP